jgi:hypothetical protein
MTTAQITLAANALRTASRNAAIDRIKAIMLPAARALAGTRTVTSPYWLEREVDLSASAPFTARTVLFWRDQGTEDHRKREPYDLDGVHQTYAVQVIVPDGVSPEVLGELARVAGVLTDTLVREFTALASAQAAALTGEAAAFDVIGRP